MKRLIDAVNSNIKIFDNYELCVFRRPGNLRNAINGNSRPNQGQGYAAKRETIQHAKMGNAVDRKETC